METMRDRLEKLKNQRWGIPKPIDKDVTGVHQKITPESLFMKKLDKSMSNIESIRKKVLADSNSYLSLFYELRKAEKEFLEILKEKEDKELMLPDHYLNKIEDVKNKIRNIKK